MMGRQLVLTVMEKKSARSEERSLEQLLFNIFVFGGETRTHVNNQALLPGRP